MPEPVALPATPVGGSLARARVRSTVLSPLTTTGRKASVCAAMAVTHMARTFGAMMGPPAETLYAVDPAGVQTIRPSPRMVGPG